MLNKEISNYKLPGAECAREVANLNTQFDIFRFLKKLTEAWGLKAFMVVHLPSHIALELSQYTVINNWPTELLHQYDHEGLLARSNVMRALKQSSTPFVVDPNFLRSGHDEVRGNFIVDLFSRFEMSTALWCPLQDSTGQRGAISFHGNNIDFPPKHIAEIAYVSAHVFSQLAYVRSLDTRIPGTLTDREIDCLNWTAAGKTSAEIADILNLSEHTVNHYLNRATKKLDTVNRTQAVAKALRVGLIK